MMSNEMALKVGTKVRWKREYIKRWVFSHDNADGYESLNKPDYDAHDYDQEILLAMFTLMNAPIFAEVRGPGADKDTVLVFTYFDGCQNWAYYDVNDLEVL